MTIRTKADIDALEARPFEEVYPLRTPWDILRAAGDNHGTSPRSATCTTPPIRPATRS